MDLSKLSSGEYGTAEHSTSYLKFKADSLSPYLGAWRRRGGQSGCWWDRNPRVLACIEPFLGAYGATLRRWRALPVADQRGPRAAVRCSSEELGHYLRDTVSAVPPPQVGNLRKHPE